MTKRHGHNDTDDAESSQQMNTRIKENTKELEEVRNMVTGLSLQLTQIVNNQSHGRDYQRQGPQHEEEGFNFAARLTKIEFPRFKADDLTSWLFKVEQFFQLDRVSDATKVRLAAIHFEEKALQWYQSFTGQRIEGEVLTWVELIEALKVRFGKLFDDPMTDLKNLKQISSVQEYHDKFDAIISRLQLPMEYALICFMAGLEEEIQLQVRIFNPKNIQEAFCVAKLQEATIKAKKGRVGFKPPILPNPSNNKQPVPFSKSVGLDPKRNVFRKTLTKSEMDERRSKGSCFNCDEKYSQEHICRGNKKPQLYHIEVEWLEEEDGDEENEVEMECAQISVNAVEGNDRYKSIRVTGHFGKYELQLLMDTGSSHNFLDMALAKQLGCRMVKGLAMLVKIANGHEEVCDQMVKGFCWIMQGIQFTADVYVMPLGDCDMVLGVQWFTKLGSIKMNYNDRTIAFKFNGQKVVLRGQYGKKFSQLNKGSLKKMELQRAELSMVQVYAIEGCNTSTSMVLQKTQQSKEQQHQLQRLLEDFRDVFQDLKSLPPSRGKYDHRIPLKQGTDGVNFRPYRYPVVQKDVIEKMTNDLLEQGVIRSSTSSFASPVVLVKKKDGTWRMCIDYRKLNQATIPDRFPIPLVEDLMDELYGTKFFSKLDLKFGYHQIRMDDADIHKTTFKTHNGHFEFLVMPFGLTNAPSTFQGLMNQVFKQYLRKYVLVFFDDILVYSPCWDTYLSHLKDVLSVLWQHQLVAKKSKCEFGATQLEYLGHIISQQGVATDPSKVSAIQQWPVPTNIKELRGFLGLTGYYRRFVKGYGSITKPLTQLLKKDSFQWSSAAQQAFEHLKRSMCQPPVLALPNFQETFVVETDASGFGIGVVLMQKGHPIAYISKALSPRHMSLSTYERELLAIIYVVQKWQPYLAHAHFVIKTDQHSLKYLLDSKISTPFQQRWLSKLMGFNFEIMYKKGVDNKVADALSRVNHGEILQLAASSVHTDIWAAIKEEWSNDVELLKIIQDIQQNPMSHCYYSWSNGELRRKSKLVIGSSTT
ncbi:uncharacterized protein LOC110924592 [Helianthus annuus]|uniref:uncharacterized protein LOC110924592 n=1 Tax=Helianthus annuus TaxID=4232 RepID=UPI000B8F1342|nr:uncharacterized protein LOC110924592 [Helianthus annuus]